MGEMVQFSGNGKQFSGYWASAGSPAPTVLVLQEWWGLVGHITEVADRFAAAGFNALAPDLYGGKSTSEPDEAGSLMMALNIAETEKALRGAAEYALARAETQGQKVGVVGFCMGGQLSLFAACSSPDLIGACVDFYGIHPNVQPNLAALACPVLGFFAGHDAYADPESVQALSDRLLELNKAHQFKTFPDAQHAFFNSDRPEVFDAEASSVCWSEMLSFFKEHLG